MLARFAQGKQIVINNAVVRGPRARVGGTPRPPFPQPSPSLFGISLRASIPGLLGKARVSRSRERARMYKYMRERLLFFSLSFSLPLLLPTHMLSFFLFIPLAFSFSFYPYRSLFFFPTRHKHHPVAQKITPPLNDVVMNHPV